MTFEKIKEYAKSDVVIKQGQKLIDNDMIGFISQQEGTNNYSTIVSDKSGEYHVRLNSNNLETAKCECGPFKSTNKCIHITGVAMKILEKKSEQGATLAEIQENIEENFLDFFNLEQNQINIGEIQISLFINELTDVYSLSIEFSVDDSKFYKVNDLGKFYHSVKDQEMMIFGAKKEVDFKYVKFRSKSQKIFEVLEHIPQIKNYKKYNRQINVVEITYYDALQLLSASTELNIEINFKKYKLESGKLPLDLSIKVADEIVISSENVPLITTVLTDRLLIISDSIYYLTEEKAKVYRILKDIFEKKIEELKFTTKHFETFHQVILPNLEKNFTIEKSEEFKQEAIEKSLVNEFYISQNNKDIILELRFIYDDFIYGWDKVRVGNEQKIVVKRDTETEDKILGLLSEYNFNYTSSKSTILGYLSTRDENLKFTLIQEIVPLLKEFGEVWIDDKVRRKFLAASSLSSSFEISEGKESQLFSYTFNVDGIDLDEIDQIILDYRQGKKFTLLNDEQILVFDKPELIEQLEFTQDFAEMFDGIEEIPIYYLLGMLDYLKEIFPNLNIDKKVEEFTQNFQEFQDYEKDIDLSIELRNYQNYGVNWLGALQSNKFGGILADEMGLGKTIQMLGYLSVFKREKRTLIVVPKALIYNWEHEIKKYSDQLTYTIIDGTKEVRHTQLTNSRPTDIIIASYNVVRLDQAEFMEYKYQDIILDEAQYIKNPKSKVSNATKKLKAESRFALTGTPIENNLLELWSIFDYIMPGFLRTQNKFSKLYLNREQLTLEKRNLLKRQISPFILRRKKNEVLKELPDKIETPIFIEMSQEQKALYLRYLKQYEHQVNDLIAADDGNKIQILALLTRLRQLACHPKMLIDDYEGESPKVEALVELLQENIEQNQKVLVFSQFTKFLHLIETRLKEEGIDYLYLDGKVKAKDRLGLVNQFNSGKTPVFLISLKAGGVGLNLTGASSVIHMDPWWNPAVENQATDRAHRIGQKSVVQVSKIIAKGTIEEKIYEMQQAKQELIDDMLQTEANIISKLSTREILELLKFEEE